MLAAAGNVIVEASEAWPVVAAGLGSAAIVALATLLVAGKQRQADSDRLDRQFDHDREMRQRQNDAESERLDCQLAHDREMRDLQHMRETLAPIIARTLDWRTFVSLYTELSTAEQVTEQARQVIAGLADEVGKESEQIRHGSRTLVVLAGPEAEVAVRLKEVANDGDALVRLARTWVETGWLQPDLSNQLEALFTKYGKDHSRFIESANETVRWRPPSREQES
jgi:hypothetical protein